MKNKLHAGSPGSLPAAVNNNNSKAISADGGRFFFLFCSLL